MHYVMLSLLVLALAPAGSAYPAQTVIHHCIGANGTPIFTDRTCASLDAAPFKRIGNPLTPRAPHGPRHCAMNVNALRTRVATTFRSGNANALAGLMLWHGYESRAATRTVQQLAQLMHWPFLGFATVNRAPAPAASGWPPPPVPARATSALAPSAPADSLVVKLGNPAQPEVRFSVVQRDGCLWLEPPALASPASPQGTSDFARHSREIGNP